MFGSNSSTVVGRVSPNEVRCQTPVIPSLPLGDGERTKSAVMLSPRGQSGLEAKILASASKLWPRPRPRPRRQTFGLGLASISLSYYVIGHFSGKNRVKFGNFVNFSGNNRKSSVFLLIIIW